MIQIATTIQVLAGQFATQPLAYAYLYGLEPGLDLDHVEVICRTDPGPRLRHHFVDTTVAEVEERLGLDTTVILLFEEALGGTLPWVDGTDLLRNIGQWSGHRHIPPSGGPE